MTNKAGSLAVRDQDVIWPPFSPLLGGTRLAISHAKDEILYTTDGREIVDLVSSWWVNIHGHGHPHLLQAITNQFKQLDHIIFAGFTHEPAVALAEGLLRHLPKNQSRVFFSDNGSTAVEVALKLALQYWSNRGEPRKEIAVLCGSYHGDTVGAMSVSERGIFTERFESMMFPVVTIDYRLEVDQVLAQADAVIKSGNCAAFIYEPLLQGVNGMSIVPATVLNQILEKFNSAGVICIADEVMTGFGRTGKWFASEYLSIEPDLVCLSKGITGGVLPLGATSCSRDIVEAFMHSDRSKTFFHGHSYTANPVSCAVALASLELLERDDTWRNIERISWQHQNAVKRISCHSAARNVRSLGTMLALTVSDDTQSYLDPLAPRLYQFFLSRELLLRPLGNTIYVLPPYCTSNQNLERAYSAIEEALKEFGCAR